MSNITLKAIDLNNFVALDVETTGLNKYNDQIIEISAVKFSDGVPVKEFTKLINPNRNIPAFITNLTGISNEMVLNQPQFEDISKELEDFIDDLPIIGHNVMFDVDFINKDKEVIKQEYICDTYYLSRIFYYNMNSYKLVSLCSELEINVNVSHRALDDAKNSGFLFLKIVEQLNKIDLNVSHSLYKCLENIESVNRKLFYKVFNAYLEKQINKKIIPDKKEYIYENIIYNAEDEKCTLDDVYCSENGMAKEFNAFEYRESQHSFSKSCLDTIHNNDILVAEAGAGLGKSLGYLIPALIKKENKKIIISTSTHNLQKQLLFNDIPIVSKILNLNIKAIIVKGKNNYMCYDRMNNLIDNIDSYLSQGEVLEFMSLIFWANRTQSGDINDCSSFDIIRNKKVWDLIKYDNDYCITHSKDAKCFYNIIKEEIKTSDIYIVNHALFVSNIDNFEMLFSEAGICIIDEAHKLSDNARDQLTSNISYKSIKAEHDTISMLIDDIINKEINGEINDCVDSFNHSMGTFIKNFKQFSFECAQSKVTIRNKNSNQVIDVRYNNIDEEFDVVSIQIDVLKKLVSESLSTYKILFKNMKIFLEDKIKKIDKIKLNAFLLRLQEYEDLMNNKLFTNNIDVIKWFKIYVYDDEIKSCIFYACPLNVETMTKKIIDKTESLILCSASLSVDYEFDYFLQEIGLNNVVTNKKINLEVFKSPYFYQDQLKLYSYNSFQDINSDSFINEIFSLIIDLNNRIKKRMLVLCTSFKQIYSLQRKYNDFQSTNNLNVFFQTSTASRENILKQYKLHSNSILIGTSSFWEGVDLPNDLLDILIILKIPFSNPNNPIVSARIDYYNHLGKDGFHEYQIPQSILKLRQGIGRLIRNQSDSGVCVIADPRLINKRYGRIIVDSLPLVPKVSRDSHTIILDAEKFLKV